MFIIACSSGAGRSSRCYDVYRRDAVLRKTVTWLMEEYVYENFSFIGSAYRIETDEPGSSGRSGIYIG